jgi:hypothetical protein
MARSPVEKESVIRYLVFLRAQWWGIVEMGVHEFGHSYQTPYCVVHLLGTQKSSMGQTLALLSAPESGWVCVLTSPLVVFGTTQI